MMRIYLAVEETTVVSSDARRAIILSFVYFDDRFREIRFETSTMNRAIPAELDRLRWDLRGDTKSDVTYNLSY